MCRVHQKVFVYGVRVKERLGQGRRRGGFVAPRFSALLLFSMCAPELDRSIRRPAD